MTDMPERKKKLIETGIPLTAINNESRREKSLRHGFPSTLHLYWARRPLATARAILFAQLVDDPAGHPEKFPTAEEQDTERRRLQDLMRRLVLWSNINDSKLYDEARQAIRDSNGGKLPPVVDPFAGGGSIPLEAQRLGLQAHASDINPLSVILNKAMIEYPSRFPNQPSVHPGNVHLRNRAEGIADDIRYYGEILWEKTWEKVGMLYPKVKDAEGKEREVIAWIWARTVINPNPANPVPVPLVRSWWLSKTKGREAWIKPIVEKDGSIKYEVHHDANGPKDEEGTVGDTGAISIVDGTPIDFSYIRNESKSGRMGSQLIAIVADGGRGRLYLPPNDEQAKAAEMDAPDDKPWDMLPDHAMNLRVQGYGIDYWADLYTNRQLTTLVAMCRTIPEVREIVLQDALKAGMHPGDRLDDGGKGAEAYADAICVYLALAVSRQTDRGSSLSSWQNIGEKVRNVFSRQVVSFRWDYAEANPFSNKSGSFSGQIEWVSKAVANLPAFPPSEAHQADAATRSYDNLVVSTDPPYYDNIGYADLSDYFYIWLRKMLSEIIPSATSTLLTPKDQELVANEQRHGGKNGATKFFIDGFNQVFRHIRETAIPDIPMTVYYAYKQKDGKNGMSTGWYALLEGLIQGGWEITATWPVRSERVGRSRANGSNALASSIVLACRPRHNDAPAITLRAFNSLLRSELVSDLKTLMESGIEPVDLSQAAIGPGISVYSRYSHIRQADGTDMPVKDALDLINHVLDEVMGDADADYDSDTRFALKWYRTYGWNQEDAGIADQLSRSCGTTPDALVRSSIFEAAGGKARLIDLKNMSGNWKPLDDARTSRWEAMVRLAEILDTKGMQEVIPVMADVSELMPLEDVRALAFRMFHEADKRGDTETSRKMNALVSIWDDLSIQAIQTANAHQDPSQGELDLSE